MKNNSKKDIQEVEASVEQITINNSGENSKEELDLSSKFIFISKRTNIFNPFYDAAMSGLKEAVSWVKRQYEYSEYCKGHVLRKAFKKGEIYEVDWGVNVCSEFSFRHYAVVLKDSNEFDPLVIVCPLKSNKRGGHPKSDINLGLIPGLNSNIPTLAVVNQIRAIDKMRIYSRSVIKEHRSEQLLIEAGNDSSDLSCLNKENGGLEFSATDAITRLDNQLVKHIINCYTNYLFYDTASFIQPNKMYY